MALKCDSSTLASLIGRCFDLAMDGRLNPDLRNGYLLAGKRLRGLFLNLVSAQFNDGTQAVLEANARLCAVSKRLEADAEAIQNAVKTMEELNKLVGVLDGILTIAVKFL